MVGWAGDGVLFGIDQAARKPESTKSCNLSIISHIHDPCNNKHTRGIMVWRGYLKESGRTATAVVDREVGVWIG